MQDDILVRHTYLTSKHGPHRDITQIVIPQQLIPTVLYRIHSAPHAGHPGRNRSVLQARLRFYWPTMRVDILKYIDKCHPCAENHGSVKKTVPIQSYPIPTEPWQTITVDLLKLPITTEGHTQLMVVIDHFSRFLVPLKDKQATSVARALIDEVFCKFNTPNTLLSHNGSEFNNQILEAICKDYGIVKTNIVAYHRASNGMVERQNRKIIENLRTMVGDTSSSWHEWMPQVMASLNSALHTSIGDTPHFIIFGQDKRLPYSILLKKEDPLYNFDDYVRVRTRDFQRIYKHVQLNMGDSKQAMNEQQWKSSREKFIAIGDIVYEKFHESKNKLAPRFEGPYRVVGVDGSNKVSIRHLTSMETKVAQLDHLKRQARSHYVEEDSEPTQEITSAADDTIDSPQNDYRKKLRSYKGDSE